ncbi:MAG: amino acid ABC transporter substrate-binding protein [Roseateles sp.]|uniref:amino acid ABC transporter substrate-binding protein n=1 Tax=Roseateles sp. TaxID=1971397 RepID=UPI0039EA36CE
MPRPQIDPALRLHPARRIAAIVAANRVRLFRGAAAVLAFVVLAGRPAAAATFVMQNEPHLAHARALVRAALKASGMQADFVDAPLGNERRNLHQISTGQTHVDLMPATPARLQLVREGRLRMIPVPLDLGLLGYRINLLLASQHDKLAHVRTAADLANFTIGQGVGWMDVDIYRAAGIATKEIKRWSGGEFAEQMEAGFLDLFPLGMEETLTYFLPHFRKRYPQLAVDTHVLVRYPWFRFVWVAPGPETDALYAALQRGFDRIVADGSFMQVWRRHRTPPSDGLLAGRRIIDITNPFYGYDLVPARYQHLLLLRRPR